MRTHLYFQTPYLGIPTALSVHLTVDIEYLYLSTKELEFPKIMQKAVSAVIAPYQMYKLQV